MFRKKRPHYVQLPLPGTLNLPWSSPGLSPWFWPNLVAGRPFDLLDAIPSSETPSSYQEWWSKQERGEANP